MNEREEQAASQAAGQAQSCCCSTDTETSTANEPCCCGEDSSTADGAHEESCCCGEGDSDCCSDSAYSCADDPFVGHKKTVVVDFLFLDLTVCDRCQGADERVALAVERCRPVLSACGYNLILNQIDVENAQLAERFRFYSSPTIRVNGVDICESIEENDCGCCSDIASTDVKCRLFPFNGTYYEVPPTDMIVRGIMETVLQGKKAPAETDAYVLPENLCDFFEGKEAKAATSGSCCCC